MKKIKSNIIGELEQNDRFDDWWESKPIEIPFFDNKKLKVTFMDFVPESDTNFVNEADKALKVFLGKKANNRIELSERCYKNCMDFLNSVEYDEADKPLWNINEKSEIWNFVYPKNIYVTRRHRRDEDIYINVVCECEWEQEHGIQLVFRQGKRLTRISDQDGHITEADAYGKSDEEDEMLNQFNSKEEKQSPIEDKNTGSKSDITKNQNRPWWKKLWF